MFTDMSIADDRPVIIYTLQITNSTAPDSGPRTSQMIDPPRYTSQDRFVNAFYVNRSKNHFNVIAFLSAETSSNEPRVPGLIRIQRQLGIGGGLFAFGNQLLMDGGVLSILMRRYAHSPFPRLRFCFALSCCSGGGPVKWSM